MRISIDNNNSKQDFPFSPGLDSCLGSHSEEPCFETKSEMFIDLQ